MQGDPISHNPLGRQRLPTFVIAGVHVGLLQIDAIRASGTPNGNEPAGGAVPDERGFYRAAQS